MVDVIVNRYIYVNTCLFISYIIFLLIRLLIFSLYDMFYMGQKSDDWTNHKCVWTVFMYYLLLNKEFYFIVCMFVYSYFITKFDIKIIKSIW